jgi:tetratricopeptide (TPR) repeat protein
VRDAPPGRHGAATPVSEALSGTIDNRFEIVSIAGVGGMAIVYRARDRTTGATVALKVMRPEIVQADVVARFAREVTLTSGMKHPGILEVIASGQVRDRPYFVMPFVEGQSLRVLLADGRALPIAEAVRIAGEVGDALAHAHARGIIHRDIKPANILLEGGKVVLADFGIARAVDLATADRLTESGVALGTAHYMSPEQASGDKVDARTDIYALACVLYEMLVGTPPFTGATTQQVLARHATSPVPGLREVRGTIAKELEDVVLHALEKVPADRYATIDEFLVDMRTAAAAKAEYTSTRAFHRRQRSKTIAAGATIVAVLAATAIVAFRNRDPVLDANRVLVLPLVMRSAEAGGPSAGEDAATMIGAAIDGVGQLRWVDGWRLLNPEQRRDVANLSADAARDLARSSGAKWVLSGRIVGRPDTLDVVVDLLDAQGDSIVARGQGSAPCDESWRAALRAVNAVLPQLVGTRPEDVGARWQDRSPKAVAAYLQGEAAFRRLQMRDALARFSEAVGHDSLLTAAALRGAQAASWAHASRQAGALARHALRHSLTPRDANFARGLAYYVEGNADSASAALARAIELDPTMVLAWIQLSETYTHLLPRAGAVDSAAAAALARAYALDTSAVPSSYHLAERAAREGNVAAVERHLRAMRAANPDTMPLRDVEHLQRCLTARGAPVDWSGAARAWPLPLLNSAMKLSVGGAQVTCPRGAYAAILATDTAAIDEADGRRFAALMGLVGLHHALGQPDSAIAAIDRFNARWGYGGSLLLRLSFVSDRYAERAAAVAREDSVKFGADYRRAGFNYRLWLLGAWAARNGKLEAATGAARELNRRADSTRRPLDRWQAQSVLAHVALAKRDTATAFALLEPLLGLPIPGDELQWDESTSMADERLLVARLLLARNEPERAIAVANVFDSSQPAIFLMYQVPSLELRASAADAAGDNRRASRFRSRVATIRAGSTSSP